jgi:hypothetical protein
MGCVSNLANGEQANNIGISNNSDLTSEAKQDIDSTDVKNSEIKPFNESDMKISDIELNMPFTDVESLLGEPISKEQTIIDSDLTELVCRYQNGVDITFVNDEVYSISVNEKGYETVRGLSVGDKVDDMISLYGQPQRKSENTYIYTFNSEAEYEVFFVTVETDIVKNIEISLVM